MLGRKIYDVIGIGFGPANLAISLAMHERSESNLEAIFFEKKREFAWHPGMLLPGAEMQISFLKDLVSLRNPISPFSFLNYLKEKDRLSEFANLRNFFPSRAEYSDYLKWAADKVSQNVRYGTEVLSVEPTVGSDGETVDVVVRDTSRGETTRWTARNVVIAPGGQPVFPFPVTGSTGRVWHSANYLGGIAPYSEDALHPYRFAVVGKGQSAAEIVSDLHQRFPNATIDCIFRGFALKPADESEFVNELFDHKLVDLLHGMHGTARDDVLTSHRDTNYAVVDAELIQKLYRIAYEERVAGNVRLRFRNLTSVSAIHQSNAVARIALTDSSLAGEPRVEFDGVILATGYRYANPPEVLAGLGNVFLEGSDGRPHVSRYYRMSTNDRLRAGIYTQGCNEATHGLSDTLLSILAIRSKEILDDMDSHQPVNLSSLEIS